MSGLAEPEWEFGVKSRSAIFTKVDGEVEGRPGNGGQDDLARLNHATQCLCSYSTSRQNKSNVRSISVVGTLALKVRGTSSIE